MSTACTINKILESHSPNQGREIINQNFECLQGGSFTINYDTLSAVTISATTIVVSSQILLSGNSIIDIINSGSTKIQNGINTFTGGTFQLPTVNITGASLSNLAVSGNSVFNTVTAYTVSATTFYATNNGSVSPINISVLSADPGTLFTGDLWATNIGGSVRLNLRVSGVTKSVELT